MISQKTTCDALIIGAGPAGSELAYRLAGDGLDVLVLEKARLDREKPCGGGIQLQELVEFGELPPSVIERVIAHCRLITPDGAVLQLEDLAGRKFSVTVRRSVYDDYLQKRARRAGAAFLEQMHVREVRVHGSTALVTAVGPEGPVDFSARLVVNAAGATSIALTRRLGMVDDSPELSPTFDVWAEVPDLEKHFGDSVEFYYLAENPEGYAWIFPKKDVVSVGIGATASSIRRLGLRLDQLLRHLMDRHPVASKKLRGYRVVRSTRSLVRFGMPSRLYGPRAILLGDAAGLTNVIHGGGIYQARKSAAIAAPYCERYLRTGRTEHLAAYDRAARNHFNRHEIGPDRKLRKVFWSPGAMEGLAEQAREDAGTRQALSVLLTSTESHQRAYKRLERKMLEVVYRQLGDQTDRYRQIIGRKLERVFPGSTPLYRQVNEILLNDHSKRLRAYLTILASEVFDGPRALAVNFSLVYEMFHTASLIHDDIMDGSVRRRGRKTLHAKYGVGQAIVAGDLLLAKAYTMVAEFSRPAGVSKRQLMDLLRVVGDTGERCCLGQSLDLQMTRKRRYRSVAAYLDMVDAKTGSLIAGAMVGGAVVAGASARQLAVIERFGRNLGIAFQIVDDSLDLLGGAKARKSVQNDLRQGKPTPMLIHTLHLCNASDRLWLLGTIGRSDLGADDVRRALDLYHKHDAIGYTQRLSRQFVEKARADLACLPDRPAARRLGRVLDILGYWSLLSE